ncbi:hypothetical protein TNIN_430061 [Trichonephila inaurata madagascariensis]|uniref:Uncharacterized protein n=1 Tax=Trichonephila inaurata madagascariensis TaxID=2747483 RepID=A0A8X6XPF8_9ARAC|nr:hypothetical protein TNIN_430061 [Trichonephila inaurata madagascariensis]
MKSRLISHLNNSSDSYFARFALLINSNMEDTSSSCSNSSRSQTPASVCKPPGGYFPNSPFSRQRTRSAIQRTIFILKDVPIPSCYPCRNFTEGYWLSVF